MNKTVTINLAGINFYMDEDAFAKLDQYLKAISASLHDESRAETMRDIEARIAELFLEKIEHQNEVLSLKAVDNVISVMGQPEDFQVDENIFEEEEREEQNTKRTRKLYRDIDHSKIGGVCMGLAHYFDISVFWVRVIFLVLLIPSATTIVVAYIIFWIAMPAALTTSEKLDMQGEKINIDNIERQVREGFSNFKKNVENADYSSVERFLIGFVDVLVGIGIFLAKIIGVLLILISGVALVALIFSSLSAGTFTIFDAPWIDHVEGADIGVPFWAATVLIFLFVGIPLFFLFLLGLKLLVSKLKSIGFTAKAVLLGLWILSLFGLSGLGIRQATLRAFDSEVTEIRNLPFSAEDTLYIDLLKSQAFYNSSGAYDDFSIKTNSNGDKFIFGNSVDLEIQPTSKNARLEILKSADGNGFAEAKAIAEKIIYKSEFKNDTFQLSNHFTTALKNKFKNQDVDLMLYLPNETVFSLSQEMTYFTENIPSDYFDHQLKFVNNQLKCLDCENDQLQGSNEKDKMQGRTKDSVTNPEDGNQKTEVKNNQSEWYQETQPAGGQESKTDTLTN